MSPARFNSLTNLTIIIVLLLIGGFMGYWVASSSQHKTMRAEQLNHKLHAIGYIQAALTNYNICSTAINNLQANAKTAEDRVQTEMFQLNCYNYASDLDIGLMAIAAYFKVDNSTQQKINAILNRKDTSSIDQDSQALTQKVLQILDQQTTQDKESM